MKTLTLPKDFEVKKEDEKQEFIPNSMEVGSLSDWFLHVDGKPKMYFNDVLKWCSHILSSELTKKYAPEMYLNEGLIFDEKSVSVLDESISGAKRVNMATGTYYDLGDFMSFIVNKEPEIIERKTEEGQFFFHGKDESCMVEGTWHDWLCFVGNVLSSETVKFNYPDLYHKQLKNDNY